MPHTPSRRVGTSGHSLGHRHSLRLGGGAPGTKGQRTSHRGAHRPALPTTATKNLYEHSPPTHTLTSQHKGSRVESIPLGSLCGTPPPPRTWGQSSVGWGWGSWVTYEGAPRDSEPSSQGESHQACNARPHLAPGATRTHSRAAAILVPAKPAPALRSSTAPARASVGSAPRPAGPLRILPWRRVDGRICGLAGKVCSPSFLPVLRFEFEDP